MTELALRQDVLAPGQRTLEELAQAVNEGHRKIGTHLSQALEQAIEVGRILLEAKATLKSTPKFTQWLAESVEVSASRASTYMRLAAYQEHIPAHIESITDAQKSINGLPMLARYNNDPRKLDRGPILALKDSGLTLHQIAELVGCSHGTVWAVLNPDAYKRSVDKRNRRISAAKKEARLAKEALARERVLRTTHKDLTALSNDLGETYGHIRKALSLIDQSTFANPEMKSAVNDARSKLYEAEDALNKALKEIYSVEEIA